MAGLWTPASSLATIKLMKKVKAEIVAPIVFATLVSTLILAAWLLNFRDRRHLEDDRYVSPAELSTSSENIGCKTMVNNFCTRLYSPDAKGNLSISDETQKFSTLQGFTRNDFDLPWFSFYRARLDRAELLPADLRRSLLRRGFFEKLETLVKRPSKKKMRLDESIDFQDLENNVDTMWDQAIDESIARRLEKKFPGSYRLKDGESTQDIETELERLRATLWSEISLALWKGHPNWKTVEQDFKNLQKSFIVAIDTFNIDAKLKEKWKQKIMTVRLALPGENPVTANRDCVSVTRNAFYYKYLNTVTVCAGYFTGGSQILTLAHELAHSIDFSSRLIDSQQSTQLAMAFTNLRNRVCSTEKQLSCDEWSSFKTSFDESLEQMREISPEAQSVHSCLQKSSPSKLLSYDVIAEKAQDITKKRISELTRNSSFFRLTSKEITQPDGIKIKNLSYLNPCAYEAWPSGKIAIDSEFASLLIFSASYRCSETEGTTRLRNAIVETKSMTEKLLATAIASESIFSARDELQAEGYSSPPTERFADHIGSYAVAEYLKQFPSVQSRRAAYLASNFWLCERPSFRSENYDQYQALSDLMIDRGVHPENEERIKDWLSAPVQAALSCKRDFEENSCGILESETSWIENVKPRSRFENAF